jgi:acyl-CoA thioester hydrolase
MDAEHGSDAGEATGEVVEGTIDVRVRYAETDQMGRAYHTHVLVWCEVGRTRLLSERGPSYRELEERGVYLPVSRLEVRYHGAARYEDRVEVHTTVERIRSRAVSFRYGVRRASDGELLAEVWTELVCVDDDGRPIRLPEDVRLALRPGT